MVAGRRSPPPDGPLYGIAGGTGNLEQPTVRSPLAPAPAWTQTVEEDPDLDNSPDILAPGESSAQDDADTQDEPSGFGYVVRTGDVAVALDTAAVFCPSSRAIILHPHHINNAMVQFNAADNGDGTWTIPDPETGVEVVADTRSRSGILSRP